MHAQRGGHSSDQEEEEGRGGPERDWAVGCGFVVQEADLVQGLALPTGLRVVEKAWERVSGLKSECRMQTEILRPSSKCFK